jgi:hypothetical protein
MWEAEMRRIEVQAGLGKKERPSLQNNQRKKPDDVAQVEEYLPSRYEALSSKPQYHKK